MKADILFLITARGGSKGIPGKNQKKINGLSLVGYKARSALKSKHCARLIISSDDADIRANAEAHGAEAPFIRPDDLATNTATSDAVILHAMDYLENQEARRYDAIMVLEPSSPLTRSRDYDAAIELFHQRNATTVVGMRRTEVNSIFVGPLAEDGKAERIVNQFTNAPDIRRQAHEDEYTMNGALYLVGWDAMRRNGSIYGDPANTYGYVMDRYHSIEIDTPFDLSLVEFMVEKGFVDIEEWQ